MKVLENKLDDLLGKKSPVQLPENAKKALAQWLPWISLVFGVLQLWAAWALWSLGHRVDKLVDYANSFYTAVGAQPVVSHLGPAFYVSLIVLVVDAVILLAAFPGLKERSKVKGWNLLFYSAILNFAYGVVRMFTDVGSGPGSLFWAALSTLIGLYFLFQVRGQFKGATKE